MKLNKKFKFNEDFSEYEEKTELDIVKSVIKTKRPEINLYRSKWSPHTDSLVLLNDIRFKMKELGIKVGSDSKKITDLKQFLATIEQIYMMINGFLGEIDSKEIRKKIETHRKELRTMEYKSEVDDLINDNLLNLQEKIELVLDNLNLNLEKNKIYSNTKKAEDMIVQ